MFGKDDVETRSKKLFWVAFGREAPTPENGDELCGDHFRYVVEGAGMVEILKRGK